jgi:hypothetical protein
MPGVGKGISTALGCPYRCQDQVRVSGICICIAIETDGFGGRLIAPEKARDDAFSGQNRMRQKQQHEKDQGRSCLEGYSVSVDVHFNPGEFNSEELV